VNSHGPVGSEEHPSRAGSFALRGLIAAVAVALAVVAVLHSLAWNRAHREAMALVASTGLDVRQPSVAGDATYDPDPVRSGLAVGRGLVWEAYEPQAFSKLPVREVAEAASRVGERLELARAIAADALAELPSAWQAAMIVGSATYRMWSLAGDPRVLRSRATWEAPLQAAARLAPGEDEPLRALAAAWVEIWPFLSPAEQQQARPALRRAFDDRETFGICGARWLAVEPDRAKAFSLVPDASWAWSELERIYAGASDWDGYCVASQMRDAALGRELQARLREGAERQRGGDPAGARQLAVGIVADAPADLRFAGAVREALALCPPGPFAGSPEPYRRWLLLALDGFVRGHEWLAADAVSRLASGAGELSAPTAALAELAGGNLAAAEVIERRAEDLNTEAWAPYWVGKALVLERARRGADAREALARVNRSWAAALPVLEAGAAIPAAGGEGSAAAAAGARLASAAAESWDATAWQWRGPVARLDLRAARDAAGFALRLDEAPPKGAVVQVRLDGTVVAVAPASPAEEARVAVPVTQGSHLLEITTLAGGRVVPGAVSLAR